MHHCGVNHHWASGWDGLSIVSVMCINNEIFRDEIPMLAREKVS